MYQNKVPKMVLSQMYFTVSSAKGKINTLEKDETIRELNKHYKEKNGYKFVEHNLYIVGAVNDLSNFADKRGISIEKKFNESKFKPEKQILILNYVGSDIGPINIDSTVSSMLLPYYQQRNFLRFLENNKEFDIERVHFGEEDGQVKICVLLKNGKGKKKGGKKSSPSRTPQKTKSVKKKSPTTNKKNKIINYTINIQFRGKTSQRTLDTFWKDLKADLVEGLGKIKSTLTIEENNRATLEVTKGRYGFKTIDAKIEEIFNNFTTADEIFGIEVTNDNSKENIFFINL